jgi:hypothetical protein
VTVTQKEYYRNVARAIHSLLPTTLTSIHPNGCLGSIREHVHVGIIRPKKGRGPGLRSGTRRGKISYSGPVSGRTTYADNRSSGRTHA